MTCIREKSFAEEVMEERGQSLDTLLVRIEMLQAFEDSPRFQTIPESTRDAHKRVMTLTLTQYEYALTTHADAIEEFDGDLDENEGAREF